MFPPLPTNEDERLAALRRFALLDTPPEASFDRLTSLAARLFDVPLAFVSFMDRERQWFKSCQGPASSVLDLHEIHRDIALCAHTILAGKLLVVEDARLDLRFADNPLVTGEPRMRFYAGAPLLVGEGHALGALCLVDFQPRVFSTEQRAALTDLAASVVSEMELRRAATELSDSERLYRQMFLDSPQPILIFDIETQRFLAVNETALAHYGYSQAEFLAMTLADIRLPEDMPRLREANPGFGLRPGDKLLSRHRKKDGTLIWVEISAHTIDYEGHAARMVIAGDVTERIQAEEALRRSLTMMQAQQEAVLEGILVVDEQRRIISYNQRLCELWNIPDEIVHSREGSRLLPHVLSLVKRPDEFMRRLNYLYERLEEQSQEEIELADGRIFERYSSPILSEEGISYGRVWSFRDITKRKEAEEALRRSEQKLSLHVQQAPLAYIEWSPAAEVREWNPAAEKIFGYSRQEVLGHQMLPLLVPERVQPQVEEINKALLAQDGGSRSTNLNRTKSGKEILCEWYNTPLVDENGVLIGVASLGLDVTEKVQAETALRESERRFREIAETIQEVFWISSPDWSFIEYVSPAYERLWGRSCAELYARPDSFTEAIHPDDRARVLERRKQGYPLDHEYRITQPGGETRWVRTRIFPVRSPRGVTLRLVGISEDVTERKQAETQLQESRQRYKSLVDYHPHTVCSIDTEGRFLEVNAAFERLTGYTEAEVRGRSFVPLVAPDSIASAQRHYVQSLQGQPQQHDLAILHKDGRRVEVRLDNVPIVVDGVIIGIYVVAEDITEFKALEAEREALLVQTEVLLADALASADHDPLTGLINHRAFHKLMEETEASQQSGLPLAVLLVDLDNFKFFNDAYGHTVGDQVLRQVAGILQFACRPQDTLARFGGDEFALLMPGATEAEAVQMADRLRAAMVQAGYRPPGYDTTIPINISVGTACSSQDKGGRMALLEAADARLRVARSGGDDEGPTMRLRRTMTRAIGGFSMLDALVTAVDNKDRYTRRHSEDVMTHSVRIARGLGLDAKRQHVVEVAALLHDVGKIGVPDAVLRKPGPLTDEEFAAVQQHPLMGAIIVGAVPGFEEILDAVRHHHERWDGEGYPFGLRGEETPLLARLMAVADAYSAMTMDRPYRKGMEPPKARRIIQEGAGTQWDPVCVAAFLRDDA